MYTEIALAALISTGLAMAGPSKDDQFVKQLYTDVLARSATHAELAQWSTFLDNGGARIQVAGAVTSSQEYKKVLVGEVYQEYLNRAPAADELNFWLAWLQQGATDDQLREQVLASNEFFQKAGSTNDGFLRLLFQDVLGAGIDQPSLLSLGQLLTSGTPRASVAGMVLTSLAGEQRKVQQWSVRFLRRDADAAMLSTYPVAMKSGATDEQIIDLMLASDAYLAFATHRH